MLTFYVLNDDIVDIVDMYSEGITTLQKSLFPHTFL